MSSATRIINLKRIQPPKDSYIYIGRGSKWGNIYSHLWGTQAKFRVRSRDEAIAKYREYILSRPDLIAALPELENKILGCYCWPLACHGSVLIELLDLYKKGLLCDTKP